MYLSQNMDATILGWNMFASNNHFDSNDHMTEERVILHIAFETATWCPNIGTLSKMTLTPCTANTLTIRQEMGGRQWSDARTFKCGPTVGRDTCERPRTVAR